MKLRLIPILVLLLVSSRAFAVEPFTFIHISDAHVNSAGKNTDNLKAIAVEVNAMNPKPELVVCTGDLVETGFEAEFANYKAAMQTFGTPVYNVPGNHETKWSDFGKFGPKRFLGQDPYYSFDHNGVHFVAMDSTLWLEHYGILDQSELTWLKRDLDKAGKATPSVLFYHHMPGFIPDEQELLRLIRPYNVKLILVGHGHTFKTWKKNGVLFQECKGAMNTPGGYRILEVSADDIKSYTVVTGSGQKTPDGVVSLKPTTNPVTLIRPRTGQIIAGQVQIRASVLSPMDKVEYAIDGDYQPVTLDAAGSCDVKADFNGVPGWHTVSVRGTDKDGMEWTDAASVRINGDKEAWRLNVSGAIERAARIVGDRLYFCTLGGDIYCVDAGTGKQVWKHNVGADSISQPAVSDGLVYLGVVNGNILALNADTGEQVWQYHTDGPVVGSPVVGEGKVFIGTGDRGFCALDAKTGKLVWRYELKHMCQIVPLYMNGVVYFGAWDGNFHALDAKTGKDVWKFKTGDTLYWSPSNSDPSTDGKRIVVTAYQGEGKVPDVFCIDVKTGELAWKRQNPGEKSLAIFNSPYVVGDRFYLPDVGGNLYCMQMSDGKEVWRTAIGQTCYDNWPVVVDGKVYVSGLRGNIACFDAATGKKEWAYSTGNGYLLPSPTVWKDLVIVPSMDGTITAIRR